MQRKVGKQKSCFQPPVLFLLVFRYKTPENLKNCLENLKNKPSENKNDTKHKILIYFSALK